MKGYTKATLLVLAVLAVGILSYFVFAVPEVSTPSISPSIAYVTSTLNCSTISTDNESEILNVTFRWWKNGELITVNEVTDQLNNSISTNLYNGTKAHFDNITCEVFAFNGDTESNYTNSSSKTIANTPPVATNITNPINSSNLSSRNVNFVYDEVVDEDEDNITYKIFINGTLYKTTKEYNTFVNISDGVWEAYVKVDDGYDTADSPIINFLIDATPPTKPQFQGQTEVNYANVSRNYTIINVSFVESNAYECQIEWQGANNTGTIIGNTCWANITDERNATFYYRVYIIDVAGNTNVSETRYITFNRLGPIITSYNLRNLTDGDNMYISVNFSIAGLNNIENCTIRTKTAEGSYNVTLSGAGSNETTCLGTITHDKIIGDGKVDLEFVAIDTANNELLFNFTNVTKITIYGGTWNLIQADRNTTLGEIGNLSNAITHVSLYSNIGHNYSSYVKGLSAYQGTSVEDGDAVYVYANQTTHLLRIWSEDVTVKNFTMTAGWNQITFYNLSANLSELCNGDIHNASATIKYVSYYDASSRKYMTHRCSLSINNNVTVVRGTGVWINVNGTSYIYKERV